MGTVADYAPLSRDEIVALTCMQAGAPPEERYIEWLGQLFAIYEGLRNQGKRPIDPANMSPAEAAAHWRGFSDNGEAIESRLQSDAAHLNCPACGGSGHVDDVRAPAEGDGLAAALVKIADRLPNVADCEPLEVELRKLARGLRDKPQPNHTAEPVACRYRRWILEGGEKQGKTPWYYCTQDPRPLKNESCAPLADFEWMYVAPTQAPAPAHAESLSQALASAMHALVLRGDNGQSPVYQHCAKALEHYRSQAPAVTHGWQPIETAPKDGTTIALRRDQRVHSGRWGRGTYSTGWLANDSDIVFAFGDIDPPTHWMPLDSDVPVQHTEAQR